MLIRFAAKFLSAVNFIAAIKTFRLKSCKPWFDVGVLNVIQNRDKHYRKFQESGKETDKGKFKCAQLFIKKLFNNTKAIYYEEKTAENENDTDKIWQPLKPLVMPSEGVGGNLKY